MDTYTVAVECSNCFKGGSVQIPKGTLVPQLCTCPNCGCETATPCEGKKQEKYHIPDYLPRGPVKWGDWSSPHWCTVEPSPLRVTDMPPEPYPNFYPPSTFAQIYNEGKMSNQQ